MAGEGGQHHGMLVGEAAGALDVAIFIQLLHRHHPIPGRHGAGIADPLHVAHAQLALQHALGSTPLRPR